ncbi:hypothetical protein [Mycobacteroides abscessus]|uniref:hypothetical protein n=1 Tax=Mycobacteroides abscessus TaxID=36809 RepID=UPI001F5FD1A8|nr:hypothetical protein [Mycobacteroides abscessus]
MAGRVLEYPPEEDPTDMPISIEFADESITKAEAAGFSFMHGFRYGAGQATIPFSVPFGVTDGGADRQIIALMGRRWNAAAMVYDRASVRGDVRRFYGRDAEKWLMSPANADQIVAQGSALLHEVRGR